jgi:polyvinyl alcohol dehydrogenase (cytochrome)
VFSSVGAGGGAGGDFTGTPIVADGCIYVGSNSGWVFAINADTGALVWKASVPAGGIINSTVSLADGKVIAAVSRPAAAPGCTGSNCIGPYVVAFDQATGAPSWTSVPIDTQAGSDSYSTPVVFDGVVMTGISGGSAELADETNRYAFQGNVVLLDVTNGSVLKKVWTIHSPDIVDDYAGGGVWSTAAVDIDTKVAYFGTGNPFKPQAEHQNTNAIIRIDVDRASPTFGTVLNAYHGTLDEYVPGFSTLPCIDMPGNNPPYYPQGIGSCGDIDLDFGASPNLFRDASGRKLVGGGQKSGVYHAADALTMAGVWSTVLGPPSLAGGIVGSTAYDGNAIYGPVTQGGYEWSVAKSDGAIRWVAPTADGAHYANATAIANGVVYTVDLKGFLDAYDSRNGLPLLHYPIAAGGTGTDPVVSWAGVSVARNTVYAAVGVSGLPNGFIAAFRPGSGPSLPGVGGVPVPAGAGPTIVAGPGAYLTTYATPVMVAEVGGTLSFMSNDLPLHDVVSVDKAADGTALFSSPLVGLGQSAAVSGMNRVEAGKTYAFFCSIHPGMRGTLVVAP